MRVSAKGEYAIKAMLDLALSTGEGLVPIQDIASRQRIPQRYLEQVLLELKRVGLLHSGEARPAATGSVARPLSITVGDVLRAVDGAAAGFEFGRRTAGPSPAEASADLSALWREVGEAVSAIVDRVTLEDLKRGVEDRRSATRPMYHI